MYKRQGGGTGAGITGITIRDEGNLLGAGVSHFNFVGAGITVTASGVGATVTVTNTNPSRTVVSGGSTAIADGATANFEIEAFKSYSMMRVGILTGNNTVNPNGNHNAWLRIYTDSTSRTNDANRPQGVDPAANSGVIAEAVSDANNTNFIYSPFVMGGNLDEPATNTMYCSIGNFSGVTTAINVEITLLQLED